MDFFRLRRQPQPAPTPAPRRRPTKLAYRGRETVSKSPKQTETGGAQSANTPHLPDEIWVQIFRAEGHTTPQELLRRQTGISRRFANIAGTPELWKGLSAPMAQAPHSSNSQISMSSYDIFRANVKAMTPTQRNVLKGLWSGKLSGEKVIAKYPQTVELVFAALRWVQRDVKDMNLTNALRNFSMDIEPAVLPQAVIALSNQFTGHPTFILTSAAKLPAIVSVAADELRNEKDFIREAARISRETLRYAGPAVKADHRFLADLIKADPKLYAIMEADFTLETHKPMLLEIVAEVPIVFDSMDSDFRDDPDIRRASGRFVDDDSDDVWDFGDHESVDSFPRTPPGEEND